MKLTWATLSLGDREILRATIAFLTGRLEERATVEWALQLNPSDTIPKLAVIDLINNPRTGAIREPWLSVWRLIEATWNDPLPSGIEAMDIYDVVRRLENGERSKSLVSAIVDLVRPRLKVEVISGLRLYNRKLPARPRNIRDVVATDLTSGRVIDPNSVGLSTFSDSAFLQSLAGELDAAVNYGLDLARRMDWDGKRQFWKLGGLHRVYYVQPTQAGASGEPDRYHEGIAPSVKLLHSVVARLIEVDFNTALEFVGQWSFRTTPVHVRMWAALACDVRVASKYDVGNKLLSLDSIAFWDTSDFPEIAELRACRYKDLERAAQTRTALRLKRLPPRSLWSSDTGADRIEKSRHYAACRELRRIETAGGILPVKVAEWLQREINSFPDLVGNVSLDDGFLETPQAFWVSPSPDQKYNDLRGTDRLIALENALTSPPSEREGGAAAGAADWIGQQDNSKKLLDDLYVAPNAGDAYPKVWNRFASVFAFSARLDAAETESLALDAEKVIYLLDKLSGKTLREAIEGISTWISRWKVQLISIAGFPVVWLKIWPIAVVETNSAAARQDGELLNKFVQSSRSEPDDLDTLNVPVGRLIENFLQMCPNLAEHPRPFSTIHDLMLMRTAMTMATGYSSIIVKHRLIQALPYFLNADRAWAQDFLVTPLLEDTEESIALWRALGRSIHTRNLVQAIGPQMLTRVFDVRLGRDTRKSLVFRLVVECLFTLHEGRDPTIPYSQVQQMIRSLDDEVRAHAADAIKAFVLNAPVSYADLSIRPSSTTLLETAAAPFLGTVWPQERSLVSPGVSESLADLPSAVPAVFDRAVTIIERFLVPFRCWSMHAYGFFDGDGSQPGLSVIDDEKKATSLLHLLDLTIGTAEDSTVPHNLSLGLDRIRQVAPALVDDRAFRRLSTAARRG